MAAASPKKVSGASGVQSMKSSGGLWFLVVMVALLLLVTLGTALFFGGSSDTAGKPEVKSLTLDIRPDGWTRWVTEVPPSSSFYFVNPAGWVRIEFWNREQRVWETGEIRLDPRGLPEGNFRLKGAAGRITIYWQ